MDIDQVRDDIAAFADDDNEVLVEPSGRILFIRNGQDMACRFFEDDGRAMIEVEGQAITYRTFLARNLARLDILAQRILAKRPPVPAFVDGGARLEAMDTPETGRALGLLNSLCRKMPAFSARVLFVTADAGHGKTALLKEYQSAAAQDYLDGKSPFLFWHVDLQGRQLLRLSEALMGDLADLRFSGVWMPGVVRLLRRKVLVLAIDGFDELAAEQGSTDALGALAVLVRQIGDQGTIVAASRRTFFDTDDYVKRTGMLRTHVSASCEFAQLHLLDWSKVEGVAFLERVSLDGRRFPDPNSVYDAILLELNGDTRHPMLARPFLLTHIARALLRYGINASDFIRGMTDPMQGVASVVEAFVQREVTEKWKAKDTGEPYLSVEQHMRLLSAVAEEMWVAQRDRLDVGTIETIAVILCDTWKIPLERKQQVLQMVTMHVLLSMPGDGESQMRSFDHPEFRDYFIAFALALYMRSPDARAQLASFLSHGQLSDTVARYAVSLIERNAVAACIERLRDVVGAEWRPTYVQTNVGTIIPFLLRHADPGAPLVVDVRVNYSSVVFENSTLKNVRIENGNFVHASFVGVNWESVALVRCTLSEVTFDRSARLQDVEMRDCQLSGIRVTEGGEEVAREYSPARMEELLTRMGIVVVRDDVRIVPRNAGLDERRELVRKFLRAYKRTTAVSESLLSLKFQSGPLEVVKKEIIPLMKKHGLLESQPWRGAGPPQGIWSLTRSVEDILRGDDGETDPAVRAFWREL